MNKESSNKIIKKVQVISRLMIILWIIMVVCSFLWDVKSINNSVVKTAEYMAKVASDQDLVLRKWVSGHGGVYVPETEKTPSNPYLEINEKDIVSPSGKKLTLMNPAYVIRQIHESSYFSVDIKSHFTSLNPLNTQYKADEWEIKSLELFEKGVKEVSEITEAGGEQFYRTMKPLFIDSICMKCHEHQGYSIGDVRGGLSLMVPLAPLNAINKTHKLISNIIHFLLMLSGLLFIKFGEYYLVNNIKKSLKLERDLSLTQARLFFNEELLYIYMDRSPLAYIELDKKFNILAWNKKAEEIFGYSRDEILGQNIDILVVFEEIEHSRQIKEDLLQNKGGFQYSNYNITKSEKLVFCEWYNTPIIDDDGNISKIICMTNDITKQKKYKEELVWQNTLFDTLINSTEDLIYLLDVDSKYLISNAAYCKVTGKNKHELVGQSIYDILDEEHAYLLSQEDNHVMRTKKALISKYESILSNGKVLTYETIKTPVFHPDSENLIGMLGVGRNITEQLNLQKRFRVLSEEKELILNSITCGVVRLDHNGNIIYINANALMLMGYEKEEVIGKNHHDIFHIPKKGIAGNDDENCLVLETLRNGKIASEDNTIFWHKNGQQINVRYKSVPLFDGEKFIGAVLTYNDIRKMLKNEQIIMDSLKEKEVLIQEIHHRVKNNMQVIYSLLSLQADKYEDNDMISQAFIESQNRILSMATVHQMLYQKNNMTSINMKDYIENMIELICGNYKYREVQYKINAEDILFDIDKAVPAGLIINEVISNSLKHSNDIEMLILQFELFRNNNEVVLHISDNGSGFPEDFDIDQSDTLGCQLLLGLTGQLGGEISLYNDNGAHCRITIPEEE